MYFSIWCSGFYASLNSRLGQPIANWARRTKVDSDKENGVSEMVGKTYSRLLGHCGVIAQRDWVCELPLDHRLPCCETSTPSSFPQIAFFINCSRFCTRVFCISTRSFYISPPNWTKKHTPEKKPDGPQKSQHTRWDLRTTKQAWNKRWNSEESTYSTSSNSIRPTPGTSSQYPTKCRDQRIRKQQHGTRTQYT